VNIFLLFLILAFLNNFNSFYYSIFMHAHRVLQPYSLSFHPFLSFSPYCWFPPQIVLVLRSCHSGFLQLDPKFEREHGNKPEWERQTLLSLWCTYSTVLFFFPPFLPALFPSTFLPSCLTAGLLVFLSPIYYLLTSYPPSVSLFLWVISLLSFNPIPALLLSTLYF
jgi:hypothetical protein